VPGTEQWRPEKGIVVAFPISHQAVGQKAVISVLPDIVLYRGWTVGCCSSIHVPKQDQHSDRLATIGDIEPLGVLESESHLLTSIHTAVNMVVPAEKFAV